MPAPHQPDTHTPAPSCAPACAPSCAQALDLLSYAASSLVPPVFLGFFHGGALIFMLLYLWSRQNPEAQVCGWVGGWLGRGGGAIG